MARQAAVTRANAIQGMFRRSAPTAQASHIPAPLGGLNTVDGLTLMPMTDCLRLNNLMPTRYGLEVRPGTINKTVLIGGSTTTEVRTIAPFNDTSRDATLKRDRLFAITDQGIYDVTSSTSNPTVMGIYDGYGAAIGSQTLLSTGWGIKGGEAGWCSFVNFSTAADVGGLHQLVLCDSVNGYHIYDPDGGGPSVGRWYKITQGTSGGHIEGVDPTTFVQVCSFKGRLWFTQRDYSRAWYLTPGAVTGTGGSKAQALDFGVRFTSGGYLKGCYTWTVDGGAGFDDYLVGISSSGDVLVYDGYDPTAAAGTAGYMSVKGLWFIGQPPLGRRIADCFGGDLFVIGADGLTSMSQIVQGIRDTNQVYETRKIASSMRDLIRDYGHNRGWSVTYHPRYATVIVNLPFIAALERYDQYNYNLTQQSWAVQTGIPALHWGSFQGAEYIGTADGRVLEWIGAIDTIPESPGSTKYIQNPISWYVLTAFNDMGAPGRWKRISMIRPYFVATSVPNYQVNARYDFDVTIPNVVSNAPAGVGALWDSAVWDRSRWGGGFITTMPPIGATGMGHFVAVELSGRSNFAMSLVGFDLIGDAGGMI
jgi:hypothetical protein